MAPADLRGQVVLLWFFAYDCPLRQPVLSTIDGWYDAYREQGLSVIGVHYPRNDAERDTETCSALECRACRTRSQDNDGLTWNAYGQRVLPTIYLIDRRGFLRYRFVGGRRRRDRDGDTCTAG
ncbi:MAG: redoxin domain-containing protein [Anaerolineae bacterium]